MESSAKVAAAVLTRGLGLRRVALSAAMAASIAALSAFRVEAILVEAPSLPDALTAADSSRAAALATCVRGNTYALPALFRLERRLGGVIPDSFTVHPVPRGARGDVFFREGSRYALLLRSAPPPVGPEFRRIFHWRQSGEFEVWRSDLVGGVFGDSAASDLYAAIWRMPKLPRFEQVSRLAAWARAGGPPRAWAVEAIDRHPELWGDPLRDYFMERLRIGWDLNQEWAARQLALHPDTTTRAEFLRLARGDSVSRKLAIIVGSRDRTAWVRNTIMSMADEALGAAGVLPDAFRPNSPGAERLALTLGTFRELTEALIPDSSEAERLALIRIAQRARPRHWLRYAALRPLAHDTAQVVRDLIWQTVKGDSASLRVWVEDAPEPDEVTPYWTADELHRALQDTSSVVRFYAYGEVSRRRDMQAADTILTWLRQDRVPGRTDVPLSEAETMIRTLGDTRSPSAFADLIAWGGIADDHIRMAVMEALRSLGDRRAAPFFRQLARVPCNQMEYFAKRSLAFGLSKLGDPSDTLLFARWARECPDVRDVALEALGVLGGVPCMVQTIRQIETGALKPEQARNYELLEARVRERIALVRTGK
jgi:HEAT repeat protein